jgi:pimeloyl-ACP methyl ester carboxylesterase
MDAVPAHIDSSVTLRDGRTLGYAEYGDLMGTPVMFFNGSASRLFYPLDAGQGRGAHARIITVERPGIGRSDFQPQRTLLDWPDDIGALADALGVHQFAVAGASAGGPYAAACAYRLPARVTALGLISSLAPFDIPEATHGMSRAYRLIPLLTRYAPWLLTGAQALITRNPEAAWSQFYRRLPEVDKASLLVHSSVDLHALLVRDVAEIYRSGPHGAVWDTRVLTGPWGFDPAAITVPTYLWHGEDDRNVPPTMGAYLARAIPHCQARFLPNEGHLMYLNHWQEIMSALVD